MRKILSLVLAALVCAGGGEARAAWHEAKSKHFVIYSDGPVRELQEFATKLEKFDKAVRIARKMEDPPLGEGGRLTIYVLPTEAEVAAIAGNKFVGGFYVPRASGSIAFVHRERRETPQFVKAFTRDRPAWQRWLNVDPETVFFHEYFHHLMLTDTNAALPRWVVEGFAEYFSTAAFERDGSVILGRPAAHRAAGLFSLDKLPLDEMLAGTVRKLNADETEELYGRAWLLTHYLSNEPSRAGQLQKYLLAIQNGKSGLDAAREAFGDLQVLRRELDRYLRSRDMGGYRVPATALQVGGIAVRPLTQAESDMLPVRMKSDRGVDEKTAPGVVALARQVAAKYPKDPSVQGWLAEAEIDAGYVTEAIAAADRALAVDPNHLQSLVYKGRALMEQATANPAKSDWAAVRKWFQRANKLDPENAEPLMLFYLSYAQAGTQPPKSAVDALLYAVALAPQDSGLRVTAVAQLLNENRPAEARLLFAPIAYSPHQTDAERERNTKVMQAIASGDARGALRLMREPNKEEVAAN